MSTAVLLDAENIFRGKEVWGTERVWSAFQIFLYWAEAQDKIESLRAYGKHFDPGTKPLAEKLVKKSNRRNWVVVNVVEGEDVAEDVLVSDLKLMFAAGKAKTFLVGSGDNRALAEVGVLATRRSTRSIQILANGRHNQRCVVDDQPGVPPGHVHLMDIVDKFHEPRKQARQKRTGAQRIAEERVQQGCVQMAAATQGAAIEPSPGEASSGGRRRGARRAPGPPTPPKAIERKLFAPDYEEPLPNDEGTTDA